MVIDVEENKFFLINILFFLFFFFLISLNLAFSYSEARFNEISVVHVFGSAGPSLLVELFYNQPVVSKIKVIDPKPF
jgi:hypothetical protein